MNEITESYKLTICKNYKANNAVGSRTYISGINTARVNLISKTHNSYISNDIRIKVKSSL